MLHAVLKNLRVKRDAVNALIPLPVHVASGTVGRIELNVPVSFRFLSATTKLYANWTRNARKVVVARLAADRGARQRRLCALQAIDRLQVCAASFLPFFFRFFSFLAPDALVGRPHSAPFDAAEARRATLERARRRLAVLDEADDAGAHAPHNASFKRDAHAHATEHAPPADAAQQSFVQRTVTTVVSNLQVFVETIHVRFEDDVTAPDSPFALGVTLSAFTAQVCLFWF